jgi:hypothetical protein
MASWKLLAQASDAGHDSRGFADQQSALRENASNIYKKIFAACNRHGAWRELSSVLSQ